MSKRIKIMLINFLVRENQKSNLNQENSNFSTEKNACDVKKT